MSVTQDVWATIFNGTSRMSDEFGVNKSVVAQSRAGAGALAVQWGRDGVRR